MSALRTAHHVEPGAGSASETITLTYSDRFLRRKRLVSDQGRAVLVDLPRATSLDDGDALLCTDGTRIAVRAAPEAVLRIVGDLPRLAWHIGNRHAPCQMDADALIVQAEPVMADLLRRLGADLEALERPFSPERGAYGHGRTHGHSHGHSHDGHDGHDHAAHG